MDLIPVSRRALLLGSAALVAPDVFAARAPAAIADYERNTGGRVGLFARNFGSGRQLAWRAHERFAMCSTFKASLAALVLARVDAGRDRLERQVAFGPADLLPHAPTARAHLAAGTMTMGAMCEAAVQRSDNTCANLLLREVGGPAALTRFWRNAGDGASRLDHVEPLLNRNRPGDLHDSTTPAAMARTAWKLTTGDVLAPASRDRLAGWMVACETGANRLRAGLPRHWRIGDKTGSNGADAAGDVAIAWPRERESGPIAIAAYVQGGQPTPAQQDALFAAIGRLVAEQLA